MLSISLEGCLAPILNFWSRGRLGGGINCNKKCVVHNQKTWGGARGRKKFASCICWSSNFCLSFGQKMWASVCRALNFDCLWTHFMKCIEECLIYNAWQCKVHLGVKKMSYRNTIFIYLGVVSYFNSLLRQASVLFLLVPFPLNMDL